MKNVWFGFPLFSKLPVEVVKNRKKFTQRPLLLYLLASCLWV